MDKASSLHNNLLIAMPGMADPNFHSTVTLICEHNEDGALGIIINRPSGLSFGGLLEQLSLEQAEEQIDAMPILNGGPVAPERGFVLHNPTDEYERSVAVSEDICLTLSRDVLDCMAAGTGPDRTLVALGYAGWEPGQLELEMLHNTWLNVPATPELVFDVPYEKRWSSAAESMGIDISQITTQVGHA